MPNTPYPEEDVPPILPSTSDFQNVVSGFLNGFQKQGNLDARRSAYNKQQAQDQAQQQFDNDQKAQASNLARANAVAKYQADNNKSDPDKQHQALQRGWVNALEAGAKYQDAWASGNANVAKAAAVAAYELSGGHYNPTGSTAALQDAYNTVRGAGADVPKFDPYTGLPDDGAPDRPAMDTASFAAMIRTGQYAPPTDQPVVSTTPTDTPPQGTNADGTPVVPPGTPDNPPNAPTGFLGMTDFNTLSPHYGQNVGGGVVTPPAAAPVAPAQASPTVSGPLSPADLAALPPGSQAPSTPVVGMPPAPDFNYGSPGYNQGGVQGPLTPAVLRAPAQAVSGPSDSPAYTAPSALGDPTGTGSIASPSGPVATPGAPGQAQDAPDAPDADPAPAFGNPFALADGHLTKDQLAQQAQALHQQQIEATAHRNANTVLQQLPHALALVSSQPIPVQKAWAQSYNANNGTNLQVPPGGFSRDRGAIQKEAYNQAQITLQRSRLRLQAFGIDTRNSQFTQSYNQRQQFHADLMGQQDRNYGLKVGSLPGGTPQGASLSKDQAAAVAATAAVARATAAVTANGGDPSKDANVQQLTAFAQRAQAQANSDAAAQQSQARSQAVGERLDAFAAQAQPGVPKPVYKAHNDGCADFARTALNSLGYPVPNTSSAAGFEAGLSRKGWVPTTTPGPGDVVAMYSASAPSHTHIGLVNGAGGMWNDTGGRLGPAVKSSPIPHGARYYTYDPASAPQAKAGPLTRQNLTQQRPSNSPPSLPGFPAGLPSASDPIATHMNYAAEAARRKRSRQ